MQKAQSKSTERASKILAAFSAERPLLRPADLSALLGVHPTTVWRYLVALEEAHLIERDDRTGCYKLGLGILQLSSLVLRQMEVRQHSIEEMDTVRDQLGLLVNLGLLQDADVIHVAHAFPVGWPRWNMDLGGAAVAQCTALGKVLLAALPEDEAVRRVETAGWRPYTSNSIRNAKALREELRRVSEQGYAVDRGERRLDTMCVAVPVRGSAGKVIAAMSVSSRDKSVVDIGIDNLVDVLQTVSRRVSMRMGTRDGHIDYF
jgi:IclR family transcriptional regulator, KDG regulon repressor